METIVSIKKEDLDFIIDLLMKVRDGHVITDEESKTFENLRTEETCKGSSKIRDVLYQLGVRPDLLGYDYLKTAISLAMEDRTLIYNTTKGLYPAVAEKHHTTPSRTERAMRHAVEVAFDSYGEEELRNAVFGNSVGSNRGKPTNSHFIAAVVEYMTGD